MSVYRDRSNEVEEEVAQAIAKTAHFLHPNIVEYIVLQNSILKKDLLTYFPKIEGLDEFLFEGSDCIYPFTRRAISKEKQGKWKNQSNQGQIVNDNTYPRDIWVNLVLGVNYSSDSWKRSELNKFELAHIFSHKIDEFNFEKNIFNKHSERIPYSLFTSASNTILLPKGMAKPTDGGMDKLKASLFKRYHILYSDLVKLPRIENFEGLEMHLPDWDKKLKWSEPVLPNNWKTNLDKFYYKRLNKTKGFINKIIS